MATAVSALGFRDVLQSPEVKRLWIAQIVSIFGDFLAIFAVFSVVTFQLHGTATQVSMIMAAYLAPLAVISPLAGVFVDKWNIKATMIASDVIRGCWCVTLIFVRDLNTIYAIFFLLSTVSSFYFPAQTIAVRTLAPAGGLLSVNALMTQAMQASQIVSPGGCRTARGCAGRQRLLHLRRRQFLRFRRPGGLAAHRAGPSRRRRGHRSYVPWAMASASSSPIR